ncbi:hypothetical protein BRD02_11795 [Halobacteriales archaeon QS_8_69_73]|nr:MAG: hypothetical protein BRD02_11795 [Halobacteriales archaeon QS_8_69_73]
MTEETPRVAEFPDVSRRRFLAGAGETSAGGAVRAAGDALLGYGELGYGTNLLEQDLAGLVADSIRVWYDERVAGRRLRAIDDDVVVSTSDGGRRLDLRADAEATAADLDGDLVVPMTFVDYTHSTLYDDFGVTSVAGPGLAAYDDRHRATHVR